MMFGDKDQSAEMKEYREQQRDSELRLLGTMLFQAVLLSASILLYVNWDWSHFGSAYEAAMFYGFAGFSIQAAFYFVYRAVFEDSSEHRRQLKKMRNTNRRRMAHLKFEQEKAQLETVLGQQMGIYQNNMQAAMADNVITPQESELLSGNLQSVQDLMQQLQLLTQLQQGQGQMPLQQQVQQQPVQPITAQSLGIDRHRIMGIPIGKKLTLDSMIPSPLSPAPSGLLNLEPQGTQEQRTVEQAQALEVAAEHLQWDVERQL